MLWSATDIQQSVGDSAFVGVHPVVLSHQTDWK